MVKSKYKETLISIKNLEKFKEKIKNLRYFQIRRLEIFEDYNDSELSYFLLKNNFQYQKIGSLKKERLRIIKNMEKPIDRDVLLSYPCFENMNIYTIETFLFRWNIPFIKKRNGIGLDKKIERARDLIKTHGINSLNRKLRNEFGSGIRRQTIRLIEKGII